MKSINHIRSLLFVPAGKLDKWNKVVAAGADMLCIDLEDSVPPGEKNQARDALEQFLQNRELSHPLVIIRINSPETETGNLDLDMIRELNHLPDGLMIPKLNEAAVIEKLAKQLIMFGKKTNLIPLIETSRALENARDILDQKLVAGAVFGGHDLAMELGCSNEWGVLAAYRSEFIRGAGGLNLSLIDMPWFGLNDADGLRNETANCKRFGFTAKAAIHPAQVEAIHSVFTPTADEVAEAKEKIRVFEEHGGHAVAWKGTVLEPPVIEQAKRVVDRASIFANENP